jgi:hypothetical protein
MMRVVLRRLRVVTRSDGVAVHSKVQRRLSLAVRCLEAKRIKISPFAGINHD